MLLNGVDYVGGFGAMFLTSALIEEDIDKITEAFDYSVARLKDECILNS